MRTTGALTFGTIVVQVWAGFGCGLAPQRESDPRFKHFLQGSAQMVAFLAHPADTFHSAHVDDTGLLTIRTHSARDAAPLVLELRVALDARSEIEGLRVVRDSVVTPPAFSAADVIKGYVASALVRNERDAALSAQSRLQIQRLRRALDTMNGRRIAEEYLRLQWRVARMSS